MPRKVHSAVPPISCVPSAPGLENPGAEMGPDEVREAMTWPNIIGLGEMMNFPGVIAGDHKMLAEIAATQRAGKTVGGHYASPDLGLPFHAYAAGGPADDHEGTRAEDAIATWLHEQAHKEHGTVDATAGHATAIAQVAARVIASYATR